MLPLEARGLYREMLTQAWRRGAKLPNDPASIRRATGCSSEEWERCWPRVQRYWRKEGDDLINETQVGVYQEAVAMLARASERGRNGGLASGQSRRSHSNSSSTQVEPELKPPVSGLRSPVSDHQSPITGKDISSVPHAAHEPAVRLTPEAVEPREQSTRTRWVVEPGESEDEAGVVLRFPVVGTHGPVWLLTGRQVTEWRGLFPDLDVIGEARKALAWILANPGRRKTGRGMLAFLVNWLSRATNMRGRNNGGGSGGKTERNVGNAVAFIDKEPS